MQAIGTPRADSMMARSQDGSVDEAEDTTAVRLLAQTSRAQEPTTRAQGVTGHVCLNAQEDVSMAEKNARNVSLDVSCLTEESRYAC